MKLHVTATVKAEPIEVEDVRTTLEAVLLDALRELQRDGRYSDLRVGMVRVSESP